jgi:hypothetical protein
MFFCVSACVHVCMCVCRQLCVIMCTCVHARVTHAYKRLSICVCARMFFCVSACVDACMVRHKCSDFTVGYVDVVGKNSEVSSALLGSYILYATSTETAKRRRTLRRVNVRPGTRLQMRAGR